MSLEFALVRATPLGVATCQVRPTAEAVGEAVPGHDAGARVLRETVEGPTPEGDLPRAVGPRHEAELAVQSGSCARPPCSDGQRAPEGNARARADDRPPASCSDP